MSSQVVGKEDRLGSMFVYAKAQLVGSRVVADNVQVLLRLVLLLKVDISVKNTLLVRSKGLDKLLSERREDHTEAAARLLSIVVALNVRLLMVLLSHDLTCQKNEAGSLHGDDVREGLAAFGSDMVWPLGDVLGEDRRPAGDVDIDILGVFIVAEKRLGVLPAVKTSNPAEFRVGDIGQRLTLSVTVDSTLNMSGLDLAAVKNNSAGLVDEGLCDVKSSPVSLTISKDYKDACLSNSSSDLVHLW